VKRSIRNKLAARKQRIAKRLAFQDASRFSAEQPVLAGGGVKYELSGKTRGISYGGIGLLQQVARESGLIEAINRQVPLLKLHLPYHESDHVLNIAFNTLCEGTCLEDIELRRNDECFLDALGAETIPDPTTAGDFCRRFRPEDVERLLKAIHSARLNVWRRQPKEFFDEALVDMDGTLVTTGGQCKAGMDISYKGIWGYHPLLVTLANTGEVLSLINRSGNRPSEEGAAPEVDRVIALCRQAGFRQIRLRGDTAFSQTEHLDRWNDEPGVLFQFGYQAVQPLTEHVENLEESAWKPLVRPPAYVAQGPPRRKPARVKRQIVCERGYLHLELQSEAVAEFWYQPVACQRPYRIVAVRKNISQERGEQRLFDEIRYFFYITNDWDATPAEIVFGCNDRCDQENTIAQLAGGLKALTAPVDNLVSNWAYMVMASLAWTLKAWTALLLPVETRWQAKHAGERKLLLRMEFKTFVNAIVKLPCQIVKQARRRVFRILNWNRYLPIFFRLCHVLRC
jgi:hypothetical protein